MTDLKSEKFNNQSGLTTMDTAQKVIKGGAIGLISLLLGRVVVLIVNILLARILGPESYGLYSLGTSVVSLSVVLAMLGLGIAIVRFGSIQSARGDESRLKGLLISSNVLTLLASIVITAILFLNADSIASVIFNDDEFGPVLRIMVLAIPMAVTFNMSASAAQAIKRIDIQQLLKTLLRPIIMIVLMVIIIVLGAELYGILVAYLLSMMITAGVGVFFLFRLYPVLRSSIASDFEFRTLLRFSFPVLMVSMLTATARHMDRFMLASLSTTYEVGLYSAAVNVSRNVTIMLMAFTPIATPLLAELIDENRIDVLSKLYRSLAYWITSLTLPIFLIILFVANEVLLLFGDDFQFAAVALIILSFGQLIKASTGPIVPLMEMGGKQDTTVIVVSLGLVVGIILNFLLIPTLGGIGASISNTMTAIVINLILAVLATRFVKKAIFTTSIIRLILIAILAWGVATVTSNFLPSSLSISFQNILSASICISVYGLLFLLFGLREIDREVISSLIKRAQTMIR